MYDESEFINRFGNNLSRLMRVDGVSQRKLAEDSGLSEATISSYINKRKMPGVKAVVNIAYALNVETSDLIDFGGPIE